MQAHFALEEHVMKEHKYKFYDEHKREHNKLLDSYTEYMVQLMNDTGVSSSIPVEDDLKYWVIQHIVNSDKRMSLMVQEEKSFKTKLRK